MSKGLAYFNSSDKAELLHFFNWILTKELPPVETLNDLRNLVDEFNKQRETFS